MFRIRISVTVHHTVLCFQTLANIARQQGDKMSLFFSYSICLIEIHAIHTAGQILFEIGLNWPAKFIRNNVWEQKETDQI